MVARFEISFNTKQQTKEAIMESTIIFNNFVRKPFLVEAVQITNENIAELAVVLGELKENEGSLSILIDRRLVPNIKRAHVGWWVTKLDDNLRCYSPKVFEKEFMNYDTDWDAYFAQVSATEA